MHARSIEVLDQRGIAERFLAEGQALQVASFASVRLDIGDAPTSHPYKPGLWLWLWQNQIERNLAGWVAELGVPVLRGREVTGLAQDDAGVVVDLTDGRRLRAGYLVGCDVGCSLVSKAAGIGFRGWEATVSNLVAAVQYAQEPAWGVRHDARGIHGVGPLAAGRARVVSTEARVHLGEPALSDLSRGLVEVHGTDFGVNRPTCISRFTDMPPSGGVLPERARAPHRRCRARP